MNKNKLLIIAVAVALAYWFFQNRVPSTSDPSSADIALQDAFDNQQSGIQIQGQGIVSKILRDDLEGSKHQRFIVELSTGQTVLIAHNIDLAPRVDDLNTGNPVAFFGEYEWNSKGGVIHWTHHDPNNRHIDGWIEHGGIRYQ